MRTVLVRRLAIVVATVLPLYAANAQGQTVSDLAAAQYTAEELDNLLAPVALYPDPILAQVLVAASYPEQVELAARHVGAYGQNRIDNQAWDISVKAVAHYTPVLNLMADRIDWTTALGQAYAEQPEDVMAAVQSLRAMARAHGNLVTTKEQDVVVEDRYIRILPARPQVVYVPVYDPLVVYYRPVVQFGVYRSGWSFGVGFPIGVWLTYDLDWRHRHVYYHGWDARAYRNGWIHRSRPFIVVNNIYVRPRPTIVVVNRRVIDRRVDYGRFNRYNYVHRQVTWDRHRRDDGRRYAGGGPAWDRDRRNDRNDRNDNGARNPSWDRNGRTRNSEIERRAVPRTPAAPVTRAAAPQPQRSQPQRAQPRSQPPRAQPQRMKPQQRVQTQPQRAQPQRTQPQRAQPQRAQPQRAQPQRAQPQRAQPQRAQPQRAQPQRAQPQRAQPQRSDAARATAARAPRSEAREAKPRSADRGRRAN